MFNVGVSKTQTDGTSEKITSMETASLESIEMGEQLGQEGDREGQQTCMLSATAYACAAMMLRQKTRLEALENK